MWPLGVALVVTIISLALQRGRWGSIALRVSRWSYALFILSALLYFPGKADFQLVMPRCQWTFDLALALHSLTNYAHIVLFALFFLLTYAQLRGIAKASLCALSASMLMGLFVELAQGASGEGNCRMRDLIPDAAGALIGLALLTLGSTVGRARAREQKN